MASEVVVIVPDPDNERGVRAVTVDEGRVVAVGHLIVDLSPDATATDKIGASVRFVGENVLPNGDRQGAGPPIA